MFLNNLVFENIRIFIFDALTRESIGVHSNELYHDACRCSLDANVDYTVLHTAVFNNSFHLPGDVVEAVVGRCGNLYIFLHFQIMSF